MKKVFISILSKNEETAQKLMQNIATYGLGVDGHFWSDNLEKMDWMGPREILLDKDVAMWIIAAPGDELSAPDTVFGLSLLSITVQAARGHGFPTMVLHGGAAPKEEDIPTPLKHAQVLPLSSATVGAKVVAATSKPFKPAEADYRMDVHGIAGIGLWFEVGPANGPWQGAMLGVSEGDIDAHGVGPKGRLPMDKMILNYPMKGLKINLGDKEYTAWAVKNPVDVETSYFLRVRETPDSLLFGSFSEEDDAEVFVAKLR